METNITGQSTNGIIGNYASDYISQAFSYPANVIGGVAQTSSHSGIRGLGAGVQVFGNTLGGSMGKEVYNSILKTDYLLIRLVKEFLLDLKMLLILKEDGLLQEQVQE